MEQNSSPENPSGQVKNFLNEHVAELKTRYTTELKPEPEMYEQARQTHLKELQNQLQKETDIDADQIEKISADFLQQTELT